MILKSNEMFNNFQNRFHISCSLGDDEHNCALCLAELPSNSESKVCRKCYEKHNSHSKLCSHLFSKQSDPSSEETIGKQNTEPVREYYCNLCKKLFPTAIHLAEHLIEHSFRGCEERGYICYICSAIFTLPCGLHQHMIEHGPSYRPYDCNLCTKKFYFRAELENHLIDHEIGRTGSSITTPIRAKTQTQAQVNARIDNGHKHTPIKYEHNHMNETNNVCESERESERDKSSNTNIKFENQRYSIESNIEEDEYIEVEQIGENTSVEEEINNANKFKMAKSEDQYETQYEKNSSNDGE